MDPLRQVRAEAASLKAEEEKAEAADGRRKGRVDGAIGEREGKERARLDAARARARAAEGRAAVAAATLTTELREASRRVL